MPCLHTRILFTLQGPKPCYLLIQKSSPGLPTGPGSPISEERKCQPFCVRPSTCNPIFLSHCWQLRKGLNAVFRLLLFLRLTKLCPTLYDSMDCSPPAPWDSPDKNTGLGCHALLQRIFPTQGSNPCLLQLLHCRRILYHWATREALTSHRQSTCWPWLSVKEDL